MVQKSDGEHGSDDANGRGQQLAYSELQSAMHDEVGRRKKAAKIVKVLAHFLGQPDLAGLVALDIGCSTGFVADALHRAGARVTGLDIDEPGLAQARERFGSEIDFINAGGDAIPLPAQSVDIVVFNHIYEHVVDADAVMADIRPGASPRWRRLSRARQPSRHHRAALQIAISVVAAEANRPSLRPCYRKSVQLLRNVSDAAWLEKDVRWPEDLGLHLHRADRLTRIRGRRYGASATLLGTSNDLASGRARHTHVCLGRDTWSASTGWTAYQGSTVADSDRVTNPEQHPFLARNKIVEVSDGRRQIHGQYRHLRVRDGDPGC